ncbi:1-acyl-sn-glycerol-3-phosphate acyltransferase [Dethiosulfatarculus sandiegensis]|uniref:Phospholipid/glycerol acyltransferase domain-containing protein n=1 Tax=Dethiosulfatarculus sandiegensis TaxID=1429043 RepID=A0A0D2JB24_9BACT|nr:1-acyl-sn-glycerol-3-phosphate acyltransferase [Dethiosulfatarculus sandiegensis]KIX12916.1 hypothetical protein X474_16765 [Dethiosulfatarculus sandiegensis]
MAAGSFRSNKKSLQKKVKGLFSRAMINTANRVDFVNIINRVYQSDSAEKWRERFKDIPPTWDFQDELTEHAIQLTINQVKKEGTQVSEEEIRKTLQAIRCRYDHDLHLKAAPALTVLMNHLFAPPDPNHPLASPDGRDSAHVDKLKEYVSQGKSVLFLSNHSSHLDEFLLVTAMFHADLGLPLFAAGANMMVIKSLAKVFYAASYVVQRRGASRVGLSGLYNFCRAISEKGGQQAIFLEAWHGGARSRDGSIRYPRRLVTLRGALASDKDLVIQPVAVSYSVVPEDLSLAARKSGKCWLRGMGLFRTLAQAIIHPKSFISRVSKDLYGRAYVTLPPPVLLSELKEAHAKDPAGLSLDEYVALYSIGEIARIKKVMASQLTARAIVRAQKQEKKDLLECAKYELDLLREYHLSTFNQEPDLEDFIRDHTLEEVLADGIKTLKKRAVLSRFTKDQHKLPKVLSHPGLAFYATHGDRRIYSPTADKNIVVVGANDWGFALTYLVGNRILEEKKYLNASLTLYDSRKDVARQMGLTRCAPGRFEEYHLPKNSFVTSDPTSAFRKASEVILVSSLGKLAEQAEAILESSQQGLKLVVGTCGFEPETHRLPCQVVYDLLKKTGRNDVEVYSLVGPVRDEELVQGIESTGVLAGPETGLNKLADLFNWPPINVITSNDCLGVQAAAILAGIYAMWGHYLARLDKVKGPSRTGVYMARAAQEAQELAMALGADQETFAASSPAWIANFVATGLSRGYREFVRKVAGSAKKTSPPKAAQKLCQQLEEQGEPPLAYQDLYSAHVLAQKHGLDLPILNEAFETLYGE